jgi:hypothetical protein
LFKLTRSTAIIYWRVAKIDNRSEKNCWLVRDLRVVSRRAGRSRIAPVHTLRPKKPTPTLPDPQIG